MTYPNPGLGFSIKDRLERARLYREAVARKLAEMEAAEIAPPPVLPEPEPTREGGGVLTPEIVCPPGYELVNEGTRSERCELIAGEGPAVAPRAPVAAPGPAAEVLKKVAPLAMAAVGFLFLRR